MEKIRINYVEKNNWQLDEKSMTIQGNYQPQVLINISLGEIKLNLSTKTI